MSIDGFVLKNIRKILLESTVIIILGIGIVYLDKIEFAGLDVAYVVVFLAGIKSVYFFTKGLRKISELSDFNLLYYEFLVFIAVNIGIMILSFCFDYFCLYKVDPDSFSGVPAKADSFPSLIFQFFYFSLMIFTNIGIIKIIPESTAAEILVIFEATLSFITIIFVLSDFLSLKESLERGRSGKDRP